MAYTLARRTLAQTFITSCLLLAGCEPVSTAPDATDAGPLAVTPDAATPDAAPLADAADAATTPAISPTTGFLGGELDLTITGDFREGTPWFRLGDGIEAGPAFVDPTNTRATVHVVIAPTAALGAHAITAQWPARSETLPVVFTVEPSLRVELSGSRTPGSFLVVTLHSADPSRPLLRANAFLGGDLLNVGVNNWHAAADGEGQYLRVLIAPGAAEGPRQLALSRQTDGSPWLFSATDALRIEPQAPTDIAPGTYPVTTADSRDTVVYRTSVDATSVVSVADRRPFGARFWLFGGEGRGADVLLSDRPTPHSVSWGQYPLELPVLAPDGPARVWIVVADVPGAGATVELTTAAAATVAQDDATPHATRETAQPAAPCASTTCILVGTLPPGVGNMQVYTVPPRAHFGRWYVTYAGDKLQSVTVNGQGLANGEIFPDPHARDRVLPPRSIDDSDSDRPTYITVRSNSATQPIHYEIALRHEDSPLSTGAR